MQLKGCSTDTDILNIDINTNLRNPNRDTSISANSADNYSNTFSTNSPSNNKNIVKTTNNPFEQVSFSSEQYKSITSITDDCDDEDIDRVFDQDLDNEPDLINFN